MLAFFYYIIRLIISILPSPESSETILWNERVAAFTDSGKCEEALEMYHAKDSLAIEVFAETQLKICSCLLKYGQLDELKSTLTALETNKNSLFSSAILNERALLSAAEGDTMTAIKQLKKAIELENSNNFAKYNFEYLSKVYRPNRNSPPPPKSNSVSKESKNEGGIVDKSEDRSEELKTTSPPEIDLAKARQLLDAMRANEFDRLPLISNVKKDSINYGNW